MDALKSKTTNKSSSMNSEDSACTADSPLRYLSPMRSDAVDPSQSPPCGSPELSPHKTPPPPRKAIVTVDKFRQKPPDIPKAPSPLVVYNNHNRAVREEVAPPVAAKVEANGAPRGDGDGDIEDGCRSKAAAKRQPTSTDLMTTAALGFRISELVLCLISFSVMATDKTQGWSGDSFDRYKEYRYCLAVAVIGFAYGAFQSYNLSYHLVTGKYVISHHLRRHFEFFMDQMQCNVYSDSPASASKGLGIWSI